MRKKLVTTILLTGTLLALSACAKQPEEAVIPTTIPTSTTAPTVMVEPTDEPVATETPAQTDPTAVPTQEAEPTVEPTATPEPTEAPHVHTWTEKETAPTCTSDGLYWEECDCGEKQKETRIPSTGHGETTYSVVAEPAVDTEGKYETTCNICSMVIESGVLPKLTPTPEPNVTLKPTATSTPVPTKEPTAAPTEIPEPTATATPKPTKAPKPTEKPKEDRIPVEDYTWWDVNHELIRYKDESCTEVIKTYYDLNLASERIYLYNYSDLKGEPIDVPVKDYPSADAKTIATIPTFPLKSTTSIRGTVQAIERCLETGWYKVCYEKGDNGKDLIGYVDDEYVKFNTAVGFTADGHHYPALEYCQFEMPYLGPKHELKQPENLTLTVGESKKHIVKPKSLNLFYQLYYPSLSKEKGTARTIGVYLVENPTVAEIKNCDYYKEGLGYYDINGSYGAKFIAKTPGTTSVTLTEYEISDYQYNDGNPTFVLGDIINTVIFNIIVTE